MTVKDHITLPRYFSLWPSSTFDLTGVVRATFDLTHWITAALLSHTELWESALWTKWLFGDIFHHVKIVIIISLICVFLHSNCSEGTCDGCTFHLLWQSQHACPLCTKNHYREIVSACIQGIQVVLHIILAPQPINPSHVHHKLLCVERNTYMSQKM